MIVEKENKFAMKWQEFFYKGYFILLKLVFCWYSINIYVCNGLELMVSAMGGKWK